MPVTTVSVVSVVVSAHAFLGLFVGSLLEILFRPHKICSGQQARTKQNERELTGHSGHGGNLKRLPKRADQ
jgi:hypothetical protein